MFKFLSKPSQREYPQPSILFPPEKETTEEVFLSDDEEHILSGRWDETRLPQMSQMYWMDFVPQR